MDRFEIQNINDSEVDEILEFKNLHFHNSDPLELAHPSKEHRSTGTVLIVQEIRNGFVLKAVETSTSKIVGFLIGTPVDATFTDETKKIAEAEKDQCRVDIITFLALVSEKANIFERFGINQCMKLRSICVHKDFRGHKIATRLLETAIIETNKLNFEWISITCTSFYTAKIVVTLGMQQVSSISYQEYNDKVGKQVFTPIEPHLEISTFVMKLKA